jgi:hypothetical protein
LQKHSDITVALHSRMAGQAGKKMAPTKKLWSSFQKKIYNFWDVVDEIMWKKEARLPLKKCRSSYLWVTLSIIFHTRKKAVNSKKVYFLSQQTNLGDKRRRKWALNWIKTTGKVIYRKNFISSFFFSSLIKCDVWVGVRYTV